MNKPKENKMNKMKVMVMAVLVLVVGSLHAQTRVDESKLTDLSYVRKICNVTYIPQETFKICCGLDNGKGCYAVSSSGEAIICILVKNDELYGRYVILNGKNMASYNLHDKLCYVNFKVSDSERRCITSSMEADLIRVIGEMGLDKYLK